MSDPKANGGIFGPLKYDPNLTSILERLKKEIEEKYPVEVEIRILDLLDKKWKNYKEKEKV